MFGKLSIFQHLKFGILIENRCHHHLYLEYLFAQFNLKKTVVFLERADFHFLESPHTLTRKNAKVHNIIQQV